MPIVHGTYYDPISKTLKCDEDLMSIIINPDWTVGEVETEVSVFPRDLENTISLYVIMN